MLKVSHPANFVPVLPAVQVKWVVSEKDGASSATVRSVYASLQQGQATQSAQRYTEAVQHFKRAESLAFKSLYPGHSLDLHLADDRLMLPAGKAIELKVAEASLRLVETIRQETPASDVAAAVTGYAAPVEMRAWESLGFQTEGVESGIHEKVAQGAELLGSGRARQAVDILQEAITALGAPTDATGRALLATATLDLSSAHLGSGDTAKGLASAGQAAELFAALTDDIGRSQAIHNQAVAQQRAGQAEQAKKSFDIAANIFKMLQDHWHPAAPSSGTPPIPHKPVVGPRGPSLEPLRPDGGSAIRPTVARSAEFVGPDGRPSVARAPAALELRNLDFIAARDANSVSVRWPGASGGWIAAALPNPAESAAGRESWSLGVTQGSEIASITWKNGVSPEPATLLKSIYEPRLKATTVGDLAVRPTGVGEAAAYLTHIYAYVVPSSLGDCYNATGNFPRADHYYHRAAGYTYINPILEAESLWVRLAQNILEWGDELYRDGKVEEAQAVYSKLILGSGAPADDAPAFSLRSLARPAAQAREVIKDSLKAVSVNPMIAHSVLTVMARWQFLNAGLDFWGTPLSPIFTFEYLQQLARGFAQQAIQAEREYINFQGQAEAEAATRRELEAALAMSQAEVVIRKEHLASTRADISAMDQSVELAKLRSEHAREDRKAYKDAGYWQYVAQSMATGWGAGEDWHASEVRRLAGDIERGYAEGEYGQLAAASVLLGGQKSYEYQLGRLDRTTEEMDAMIPIAEAQLESARHREEAARLSVLASEMRRDFTADALAAFEEEIFTPEVWTRMAQVMRQLSSDYQHWAIRSAKLMQRAYNFETDGDLEVIKSMYLMIGTAGLLGSDLLMRDIESFTYHYVTHQRSKTTNLKEIVSLANDYPFQFYEFQRTGRITLETALRDFDQRNPGFYSQRVSAIEVEMVALMPPGGVHGYLRSGTISRYRAEDGATRTRLHLPDTAALSDYSARGDGFLFRMDPRMHGLFEGHGVSGTWELTLPRRSNNLDYRLISDVRLVFYYTAKFSPALRKSVLSEPALPGELVHVRSLQPRWDFPEAWYEFLDTGRLEFDMTEDYFPRNEKNFRADKITIQLLARDGVSAESVDVTLKLPDKTPAELTTDADGAVATEVGNAFAAKMGGPLVGPWVIELKPQVSGPLDADGKLRGDLVEQVALIVQYAFDWPE